MKDMNDAYQEAYKSKGRERRAEIAKAAKQDKNSKKTPMQHNIKRTDERDSWTLKERVLLYPELDWTDNQRRMAGLK